MPKIKTEMRWCAISKEALQRCFLKPEKCLCLRERPGYHCAQTNPEMWAKFTKWFFSRHCEMPKALGWTEEAVSAWKGEFDVN